MNYWASTILIVIYLSLASSKSYKCSIVNEAGFCFLENVIVNDPISAQHLEFPKQQILLIKSGSIPNFSKDMYTHFSGVRLLHMYNNTAIRKFLIAVSNLTEINLQRNGLLEFEVEPTEYRNLKTLTIVHNAISVIPKNIRYLEGLEKLFLYNNSLEYVDLELFTNATNLKVLSLYDNFIKTLDSKLGLRFAHLQTLSLSKNKLSFIPYFAEAFPALNAISLRKNPWNCRWLEFSMGHIEARSIQIARKDTVCRYLWVGDICCYRTVVDFLFQAQGEELRHDREQLLKLAQENRELRELVQRLNESVIKLEERVVDNKVLGGV
ncbi:leucine-rich repeat-containing protein 15-like [Armigeres subalbatus]|uniref:leucine-rich repeat-containing protein 15-like n=1 Tax=Armigeres subalbatus TaxID=124917 RepID=UPI002ECFBA40